MEKEEEEEEEEKVEGNSLLSQHYHKTSIFHEGSTEFGIGGNILYFHFHMKYSEPFYRALGPARAPGNEE